MKPEQKELVTNKQICAWFAYCAVRQSPYRCPRRLEAAIDQLSLELELWKENDKLVLKDYKNFLMGEMSFTQLRDFLELTCEKIPEIKEWNNRRNGRDGPFGFISAYDGKRDPDDDFIDLGALCTNVARCAVFESLEERDSSAKIGLEPTVEASKI